MPTTSQPDSRSRIRRLRRIQIAAVAIPTLLVVIASFLIAHGVMTAGDDRRELETVAERVSDLRRELQSEYMGYWRARAERGGAAAVPPSIRRAFVDRARDFEDLARRREQILAEIGPIVDVRRSLDTLSGIILTGVVSQETDPAEIARLTAAADRAVRGIDEGLARWEVALEAEVRNAGRSADRFAARLLVAFGVLIAVLVAVAWTMWATVDRQRRRALAQMAGERDATRLVMTTVQDGLAEVDPSGVVLGVNQRMVDLIARPREELVGRPVPWWPEIPPDFTGEMDLRLVATSGVERDVLLSVSPLANGQGALHVVKDMTLRRRAERQLRELATEREVLRRVATFVATGPEPDEVFRLVAAESARLLGGDAAVVRRLDHEAGRAEEMGRSVQDGASVEAPPSRIPLDGDDPVATALRGVSACRVEDTAGVPGAAAQIYADAGYRSIAIVPIRSGATQWGTLEVLATVPGAIPLDAETRLMRFAELVGMTVTNADAHARLADQAGTDPLTGLANHRRFHERLRRQFDEADGESDLSVVMIDLDRFQDVNIAYGHRVGDEVLAEVARRLAAEARSGETVARIGGEEFAWILPGTDGLDAWRAAERGRRAIAEAPFPGGVGSITASAGVADRSQAATPAELMRLAEGALYWAKATGRNVTLRYSADVVQEFSADERAERLARTQAVTALRVLARAVDAKDPSTARHSVRVATLSVSIARGMGWGEARLEALEEAALLHDVGKIGVPDALLLKPTPLTDDERAAVAHHAALGAEIVSEALSPVQVSWVRSHHERWDGTGYPDRLAADDIPTGARIIAVADAWDAMTSVRTYGHPRADGWALDEITRNAGRQFAPEVVEAFVRIHALGEIPRPDTRPVAARDPD